MKLFAYIMLPLLCGAAYAYAQDSGTVKPFKKHQIILLTENDAYFNPYIDRDYSAGTRIAYSSKEWDFKSDDAPDYLRWLGKISLYPHQNVTKFTFAVSQEIYTPETKSNIPPPDEYPYGGFLYLSAGVVQRRTNTEERIWIEAGITGPASFAQNMQDLVHNNVNTSNNSALSGWDYQIKGEFVFNINYQFTGKVRLLDTKWFDIELLPAMALALGNGRTHLDGSAKIKMGYNTDIDFGVSKINFAADSPSVYSDEFSFYVYAGAGGRIVARNMFIQGNSWESPRLSVNPFVYYLEAGLAIAYKGCRVVYGITYKSKEFTSQKSSDTYGSISVSFAF